MNNIILSLQIVSMLLTGLTSPVDNYVRNQQNNGSGWSISCQTVAKQVDLLSSIGGRSCQTGVEYIFTLSTMNYTSGSMTINFTFNRKTGDNQREIKIWQYGQFSYEDNIRISTIGNNSFTFNWYNTNIAQITLFIDYGASFYSQSGQIELLDTTMAAFINNTVNYDAPGSNNSLYILGGPSSYSIDSWQTKGAITNNYEINESIIDVHDDLTDLTGVMNTIKTNLGNYYTGISNQLSSILTQINNINSKLSTTNATLEVLHGDLNEINDAIENLELSIDIVTNNNTYIQESWEEVNNINNEFNIFLGEEFDLIDFENPMYGPTADVFTGVEVYKSLNDTIYSQLTSENFVDGQCGVLIGLPIVLIIIMMVIL